MYNYMYIKGMRGLELMLYGMHRPGGIWATVYCLYREDVLRSAPQIGLTRESAVTHAH